MTTPTAPKVALVTGITGQGGSRLMAAELAAHDLGEARRMPLLSQHGFATTPAAD